VRLSLLLAIGAVTTGCLGSEPSTIILDADFNETEVAAAQNAATTWESRSGGAIHLDIISRRTTAVGYSPTGRVLVHTATWDRLQDMRERLGAAGDLCGGGLTGSTLADAEVWIVMDRPDRCPPTYVLMLHEWGHLLENNGAHVGEGEGIMQPNPDNAHRVITQADLALVAGGANRSE